MLGMRLQLFSKDDPFRKWKDWTAQVVKRFQTCLLLLLLAYAKLRCQRCQGACRYLPVLPLSVQYLSMYY